MALYATNCLIGPGGHRVCCKLNHFELAIRMARCFVWCLLALFNH